MNVALMGLLTLGLWTAFQQQTPPAREAYAEIGGARIWFKDTGGTGVPVVFLHAATGSVRSWEKQYPVFTAAGYRVIAFDRRGWGRTTVQTGTPSGTAADDLQNTGVTLRRLERFWIRAADLVQRAPPQFEANVAEPPPAGTSHNRDGFGPRISSGN